MQGILSRFLRAGASDFINFFSGSIVGLYGKSNEGDPQEKSCSKKETGSQNHYPQEDRDQKESTG
jgi:hypothetical protein